MSSKIVADGRGRLLNSPEVHELKRKYEAEVWESCQPMSAELSWLDRIFFRHSVRQEIRRGWAELAEEIAPKYGLY